MAGADYYSCDKCGAGKIFYDANIDWDDFYSWRLGSFKAICKDCAETHEITFKKKKFKKKDTKK